MSKRGLPLGVKMRHDSHYVDELATASRTIGRTIQLDLIEPNPEQPRVEFGDLTELTESIKEKGVLEPLLVKRDIAAGKWMIIAGERRWRASRLAGLTEVPCIEMDLDEKGVAEIALIENLQRKDLTIWEEADGLAYLSEKFGYKHDEIARKISKSRSTVTELMSIAGLPAEIRTKCLDAKISSKSTLLEIARQFDESAMFQFLDKIAGGRPTRDEARTAAKKQRPVVNAGSTETGGHFSYDGPDDTFRLQIYFPNTGSTPDRQKVLAALKWVFDDLRGKSGTNGN